VTVDRTQIESRDPARQPSLDRDLPQIYARRFSDEDTTRRGGVWRELTRYLQRYVPADAKVLDLACDRGAFINGIHARERWAVDMRDVREHLAPDVRFVQSDGLALREFLDSASFDVVFMSNFLEHLPSADVVVEQLKVTMDLLRPGGRVVILQPNIRLVGASYWDFLDHKTPLTEKSLEEAATTAGFDTEEVVTRFIPYTTKSRFPQHPLLVRAYLGFRPAWLLLGRQTLYVGRRPASPAMGNR
jgi:SAM-dependent methyltransferase